MASLLARAALAAACLALAFIAPAAAQPQAGPGTWSSNQTWAADTSHGGVLTGYYYWPSTAPALGGKRALVLVLHGCAQTAEGDVIDSAADGGYNWKAAADRYGAVILAPNATGNLYGAHCWDWAAANRSRSYGHSAVLLDLVGRFLANPQYAIDPRQVYAAGLSSGGGKTMMLACQAPEIFAGIGINAGPPPGVTAGQIGRVPPGFTPAAAADNCRALAGANSGHFATQVASVIWGTRDFLVAQDYGRLDAAAMRRVYGGSFTRGAATSVPLGGSNLPYVDANGRLRTSEIVVTGMGHAWPAGPGGQAGNFVDASKVDYPDFLMDFWFGNNLRIASGGGVPALQPPTGLAVGARSADSIALSWNAANGATGYHLYRDAARVNGAPLAATSHVDSGLAASTSHTYQVTATAGGVESAKSASVTASTTSCFVCTATTATNAAHVQAGRAHNSGIYAFANGSNLIMGLDSSARSTTLAQIAPGYYILGHCP